ncbi:MAG TPA: hypothetical protein VH816_05745 [Gaiellaceae bacterium]|jgi:hypothetical protein
MLIIALVLAAILIVGILLAPLGAGIVVVAALIAIGIVGLAVWGLFWGVSRRPARHGELGGPELLGPGGPDDPDRDAPPSSTDADRPVDARAAR